MRTYKHRPDWYADRDLERLNRRPVVVTDYRIVWLLGGIVLSALLTLAFVSAQEPPPCQRAHLDLTAQP